jgi:hypothetical protein
MGQGELYDLVLKKIDIERDGYIYVYAPRRGTSLDPS